MLLLGDGFVAMGLLILAGIVGFFVMAAALALRFGKYVLGVFMNAGQLPPAPPQRALFRATKGLAANCPHRRCGHQNPPTARFCGRCGRPLRGGGTDAYA